MAESFIIQIGTASPDNVFAQKEIAQHMGDMLEYSELETRRLIRLYQKTAISQRYTVFALQDKSIKIPMLTTAERMKVYEEHACQLAMKAINNGIDPKYLSKITHIITVSCTGMYAPGLDIELVAKLNLSSNIERTCINFMGCYGVFNALKMADYVVRANPESYVLIVSVELCTLHFQPMHQLDNLISNAIFADGAGCALISSHPYHDKNLKLKQFHCGLVRSEQEAMAWYIRDHGFDIRLSSYVPKLLSGAVTPLIEKLFSSSKFTLNDIAFFAIHPGGKEILTAIEKNLEITADRNQQAHDVLNDFGNMSSATILFVLQKLLQKVSSDDHQKNVLAMAFGPGLTMESALLELHVA